MKKVLVTGATGFIGEHVINTLLLKGFDVIATSKNEDKARLRSWFSNVKYIAFDLAQFYETTNYFEYFGSPDLMLHLAWEGLPNYKNEFHITENLPRHFAFVKNMIKYGLKDLTVSGTCFEYGMQEGSLSETMDCFPDNPYAIAKNKLQLAIESLLTNYDFNFKWVRFFYMYGPGQNPKSLIAQLDKALENNEASFNMSGGEQVRDFLPVNLIANYFIQIATQNEIQGIINCCSGEPISVKDFVVNYLRFKNKHIDLNLGFYPYADYEPMQFWGDNTKLKKIIS